MADARGDADVAALHAALAFGGGGGPAGAPEAAAAAAAAAPAPRQVTKTTLRDERFTVIWPAYLDPTLTGAQGRRLPRAACAGCERVTIFDLADAAAALGFVPGEGAFIEQAARYPRANFPLAYQNPGRARVQLRGAGGAAAVPGIDSKEKLLRALARAVPLLESRRQRLAHMEAQQAAWLAARAREAREAPPPPPPPAIADARRGGGKKGGKRVA